MINYTEDPDYRWLIETYFSRPDRIIGLNKGDILLEEGQPNTRLYLIREGHFTGYVTLASGEQQEKFRTSENVFLGLHSFFSGTYKSLTTVRALTAAEVVYVEKDDPVIPYKNKHTLAEQFMPFVVKEMVNRQENELSFFKEKQKALKQLLEREKLASLGHMAAGIAHELNNAVAVIYSNANWLIEKMAAYWREARETALFEAGLLKGRDLNSRQKRELQKVWQNKHKLDASAARALAQTGLPEEHIMQLGRNLQQDAHWIGNLWEIGATLNDMRRAAKQASHVVKSVKLLGAPHSERMPGLNINESIENALNLLRQKLTGITLELDLKEALPPFNGNMGEFVQVWTNLVKNAIEAMKAARTENPHIKISSKSNRSSIHISISDNGPGIPPDIRKEIFEPNVTTKVSGMSFGLGLGLTIVKRIVTAYKGRISVKSSKEGTTFTVTIPMEKAS